ncbi:MAG: hypothetical protein JRF31_11050 [Deltaproteobacteria bacterium]|nr:hypothetical protein [Deltaproteobacteria bacterium]MBW2321350.1 hypothetical protein [Deltaproteobacteria bacterium]
MMIKSAIQKIYLVLSKQHNKADLDPLCRLLSGLFSHVNLTSNLYLVAGNLSESMPRIERIQKEVGKFLKTNLFARLYLHFVHSAPLTTAKEIDYYFRYYYQPLKRGSGEFDREGFIHQEVPRLILLPVYVPDSRVESDSLIGLFNTLKSVFMLPCLYLDGNTFFLAQDEDLMTCTEKVYFGKGGSRELDEIACHLFYQDLLDESLANLAAKAVFMSAPCPASLIVSAKDGKIYCCMDAFRKNESLTDGYGKSADELMELFYDHDNSKRDCLECRRRTVEVFANLPVSETKKQNIGALLSHLEASRVKSVPQDSGSK